MKKRIDLQEFRKGKSRGALNPIKSTSGRKYPVKTYLALEEKTKLEKIAREDERDLSSFLRIILKKADCI